MKITHGDGEPRVLFLSGRLTGLDNYAFDAVLEEVGHHPRLTLDMSELEYVDSFGIGLLLVAGSEARTRGGMVKVRHLRPTVDRIFHLSNLDSLLPVETASRPSAPEPSISQRRPPEAGPGLKLRTLKPDQDGTPVIGLAGRFTFIDHQRSERLFQLIEEERAARIILDLEDLELLDTTGLSMLMLARQWAASRGVRLSLASPRPAVARLMELAQMNADGHEH